MREILFRGKTAVSDQWKYGGYESMPHTEHLAIIKENNNRHTVFNSTVGQYIGIKDQNKNKIFEGDILYNKWRGQTGKMLEDTYIITYQVASFVGESITHPSHFSPLDLDEEEYKIIGNIHDNPELLKL